MEELAGRLPQRKGEAEVAQGEKARETSKRKGAAV